MVSTTAFHARVRGSVPGLGGLKETNNVSSPSTKVSIVGSLRDREVACSASDRQGSNFGSCVWRTVSSQSSHHPQEVLLAQFSLYVHKGGLKPDSFHFYQDLKLPVFKCCRTKLNIPLSISRRVLRTRQCSYHNPASTSMFFYISYKAIFLYYFNWKIKICLNHDRLCKHFL